MYKKRKPWRILVVVVNDVIVRMAHSFARKQKKSWKTRYISPGTINAFTIIFFITEMQSEDFETFLINELT